LKAPDFWNRRGGVSAILTPFSTITRRVTARRMAQSGFAPGIPVICVGNAGVGGAGKTILVLDLLRRLKGNPFALTRGYRGRLRGPVLIEPRLHDAADAGDEALLLAAHASTVLARDRVAGARLALAEGATAIIMDDGLQNPALAKTVSFLVVDGGYGFGNGRLLPAGPLREPVATAAARCQAAVLIGEDTCSALAALPPGLPVLRASLVAACKTKFAGRPVLAFAGIGRPQKFFDSVAALGGNLVEQRAFPDHHFYSDAELQNLLAAAEQHGADLATTEKDFVKLPPALQARVLVVTVSLAWEDDSALQALLP
jgi:tetraacyldisaccharide 4'-kinase